MKIIIALLIFTVIIVIHELGHFLLAKKNGVFVREFSIGMGNRIITLVKTDKGYRPRFFLTQREFDTTPEWQNSTKYSWKLFPIGGSCIMLGEDELVEDDRAFNKKGVWARISVIFAGPLFNFILAFVLSMIIIGMTGYDPATVESVDQNSAAEQAGLKAGDRITNINGKHIDLGREIDTYFRFNPVNAADVTITYVRDGEKHKVTLVPVYNKTYKLGFGYPPNESSEVTISTVWEDYPFYKAGIQVGDVITKVNDTVINNVSDLSKYLKSNPLSNQAISITFKRNGQEQTVKVTPAEYNYYTIGMIPNLTRVKTNAFGVIKYSALEVKYWIVTTVDSLEQLIVGKLGLNQLSGPVGIVDYIGDSYNESKSYGTLTVILNLLYISILLSANLGVMNLLPIPALDGGRLVFLLIEAVRGKPVDQTKEGLVHMIGLIALMILMVYVLFNDIGRLI